MPSHPPCALWSLTTRIECSRTSLDPNVLLPDHRIAFHGRGKLSPALTILALFGSPALRIARTTRLLSLGRTLPESRLRRLPFGILSRCQLPRPNCQRTKRADEATRTSVHGTPTARDCHGQRFAPAATLSAIRTGPRPTTSTAPTDTDTCVVGTSRLEGVTSGEAGTDLRITGIGRICTEN